MDALDAEQVVPASNRIRLPFGFAKRHGVLLQQQDHGWQLYIHTATAPAAVLEVRRMLAEPFQIKRLSAVEFEALLEASYQRDSSEAQQLMEDIGNEVNLASLADDIQESEDLLENEDDAPIIKLINAMLGEAIKLGASDIHVETFEKALIVRFRVDGILREVLRPNRRLSSLLVSRIKVMAKLDIAEKRVPQDGRISLRIAGRAVDVRVSTLPNAHGERAVLRLLDKSENKITLQSVGMEGQTLSKLKHLIAQPHGIILVTGPTGSGKTTTLYAALNHLDSSQHNILTVEDPIEYELAGVGQTQVNAKIDLTFAKALRAILRQDPDIIMIGEIRDFETAQIAVQASLTGHLVLATLHTNDASSAVTRLTDMGVEPFLLSSSLLGVLAQRLVRKLCKVCHGTGCPECGKTGYHGRTGIYELLVNSPEITKHIHSHSSEAEIKEIAITQGMTLMREDGERLVQAGITSREELIRVTRD